MNSPRAYKMFKIETEWGALTFKSHKDAEMAWIMLESEFGKIRAEARWCEITRATDFIAVADPLSREAVESHPTVHISADLVFLADLDQRGFNNMWELREFCYYKIDGKKYRAEPADFVFGFDMDEADWTGDKEERGGEFMEVKASAAVYIICTNAQLAARAL